MKKMTTSVKVEDFTKQKIDRLQAQLFLETGQKVTQQQILELLAEWGINNLETIKNLLLDTPIILTDQEIQAYDKVRFSTGIKTDPSEIDKIVYGD